MSRFKGDRFKTKDTPIPVNNVDKIFDEFWKDIVCNDDGSINIEQLKQELADFHYIMEQVPKVYCHITGNLLSYVNYPAETVIRYADEYYEELYNTEE